MGSPTAQRTPLLLFYFPPSNFLKAEGTAHCPFHIHRAMSRLSLSRLSRKNKYSFSSHPSVHGILFQVAKYRSLAAIIVWELSSWRRTLHSVAVDCNSCQSTFSNYTYRSPIGKCHTVRGCVFYVKLKALQSFFLSFLLSCFLSFFC